MWLAEKFKRAAQPGSWRLKLAPLPAWPAPRVGQDQRGRLSWTLLHLGLACGSAHLGFNFPKLAVGAHVDVPTLKPDVTIPPVMLNSHALSLSQTSTIRRKAEMRKFFATETGRVSVPVDFAAKTCHTTAY